MAARHELTSFIEERKDGFGGVIDLYSNVASFLVDNGIGEATDLLADRREALRRLRQLREGLRRRP